MKYLVDTDWVIDHLREEQKVTRKLEELAADGLAISIISLAELYEGVFYSRDPGRSEEALRRFLHPDVTVLVMDDETCRVGSLVVVAQFIISPFYIGAERGRRQYYGDYGEHDH